jgi:NADH-quinone oxidoreductase subunit E
VPVPGPQNGRYAAEPKSGLTSLTEFESGRAQYNASAQAAVDLGETVKRIDGTEVPILAPWRDKGANHKPAPSSVTLNVEPVAVTAAAKATAERKPEEAKAQPAKAEAPKADPAPDAKPRAAEGKAGEGKRPEALSAPRAGKADDLKRIKGIGPKLEKLCNSMGFYHFDQVAAWTEEEVSWVDRNLEGFKGRVSRDDWVEQAKLLAEGKETEFSARVKKGDVY